MALITKSSLLNKATTEARSHNLYTEANQVNFSARILASNTKSASVTQTYDIFLSHSYQDARLVKALRDQLIEAGFTVYVDWIEDAQLNRGKVTKHTAELLRKRMNQSKCLLFMTSNTSSKSVWMPWELGYMDAKTNERVAIAPIVETYEKDNEFRGQEYLGIYPYLDLTGDKFYIQTSLKSYVGLERWIQGVNPTYHS